MTQANNRHSLRVLLIEDDDDDALITRELLHEGSSVPVELDWIDNARDGLTALRTQRHDIALVDLRLGPDSGLELVRAARDEQLHIPVILLTGQGDRDLDTRAVEIGAADFLVKGLLDAQVLFRSIRYAIDRALATASLARSEARYRLLFENNPQPMCLATPQTRRIQAMNLAALAMYGYTGEQVCGLSLCDLEVTATRQGGLSRQVSTEGVITRADASLQVHRRRDGSELYVEVSRQHIILDDQPLDLMMLADISERIESNRQLRLMKRGIESSYNGIIISDANRDDMPVIYANPAFERITGYTTAEIMGHNCRFLQGDGPDEANTGALAEVRGALRDGRETSVVLRNYRKDGTPFWNELFLAPIRDDDGDLTHFIGIQNDISEKRSAENALAYNFSHDVLTGLPNRSLLEDRLTQACQFAGRVGRHVGLLFFDLDGFKPVNDSLGHQVGDQILIEVARRLKGRMRSGDTVARGSGDEFIVVLPDLAHGGDIVRVVEGLIQAIAEPYQVAGHALHLTASAGIAIDDGTLEYPMELLQQADLAMYRAKQMGRNTYQWYSSELNREANLRVTLRNDLQTAIDQQQLTLHYQPVIDGRTSTIRGSEALVRWQHPRRGLISPADFIPLAEDTGQIISLGRWVLEQACRDNQHLRQLGHSEHRIAVNVSPLQLRQPGFVTTVTQILTMTGMPAAMLELEIVESAILHDTDQVIASLLQLRDMGVGIAIDDFGTGFSSLSYLKLLPATRIKIDRIFIKDVIQDRRDAAITQGILSMAHHLGLEVVAEGVESSAQAAFLRKHQCDLLQGFAFSRPLAFNDLVRFLGSRRGTTDSAPAPRDTDQPRQTLLLLDDEENILKALARVLRRDGYRILSTTSISEAFELLASNDVQVIVSDQRMPEMSGTDFLSEVKSIHPDTVRIVLSGYTDLKSVTAAINEGAIYKFLTKPWDDQQIRNQIRQAFLYHGNFLARPDPS